MDNRHYILNTTKVYTWYLGTLFYKYITNHSALASPPPPYKTLCYCCCLFVLLIISCCSRGWKNAHTCITRLSFYTAGYLRRLYNKSFCNVMIGGAGFTNRLLPLVCCRRLLLCFAVEYRASSTCVAFVNIKLDL